jgi:hypothetical protein
VKTIVWDVDDVLNDLMRAWFDSWWRPAHPDCSLSYHQLSENPPHRILGISLEEYLESLDAFRLTSLISLEPVPDVFHWFQIHGPKFRHVVLTAIPLHFADLAAAWILKHYGTWIRSFNLIPSPRNGEAIPIYDQTKKDFLCWWGKTDILVDDSSLNIQAAGELGLETILMPRPWNSSDLSIADALYRLVDLAKS